MRKRQFYGVVASAAAAFSGCASPDSQPLAPVPLSAYVIRGEIYGQLAPAQASRDARVSAYGYFEGDSAGRLIAAATSANLLGQYRLKISDNVPAQPTGSAPSQRRWRAVIVVEPIAGADAALTVAESDWIISAGELQLALRVDVSLAARGTLPAAALPISLPSTLPVRTGPADLSRLSDSSARAGGDVFVRTTAFPDAVALVRLAQAGLRFGEEHSAFHVLWFGWMAVWGRVDPASELPSSAIARVVELPFVTGVEPMGTMTPGGILSSIPLRDYESLDPVTGRRLVYDRGGACYVDFPTNQSSAPVTCRRLVVGLVAGVRSADITDLRSSVGAKVIYDRTDPPNGFGALYLDVPDHTERAARKQIHGDPRIRYVEFVYIGTLSTTAALRDP